MAALNPVIGDYITAVECGDIPVCEDQLLLCALVRRAFADEDIYTDDEQLSKYLSFSKYFGFDLYPWERFITALHLCTYRREDGLPRWPDMLAMIGRGSGKDGYIAFESMALTSEYNGIRAYDVDICANNEDQAQRPVKDLIDMCESPQNVAKMQRFFYWTKEYVFARKTRSLIKGRTNSPKGKDGLRSGCIVFNEIHQYQDYANINVFTTGLGKKKHPRRSYFTTNGNVRMGPLDDYLEQSDIILRQNEPDRGFLPFLCRLDKPEDVHDPANWPKATPSILYQPSLKAEIEKEYREWSRSPETLPDFMAKRMNRPSIGSDTAVTNYENIKATNRELPDLRGWACVAGIDYASISDFASACLHFRDGDSRFDISHSWVCARSADLPRIHAPLRDWERDGYLTFVNDVEIPPQLICSWLERASELYDIRKVALDNYRFALLRAALADIGFDPSERKNVQLVRPSDIMKVQPVISSCFGHRLFAWGDNPVLRWATNNTKLVRSGRVAGTDTGNFYYAKIEGKSRKTDPFMALVAAMCAEGELDDAGGEAPPLGVII